MIRKVLLMVGMFATLLAAFFLYRGFTGREPKPLQQEFVPRTSAVELCVQQRDKEGRLRSIYRAKQWSKIEGARYLLIEPNAVIFQADGQQVHIRGDRAEVVAEEISGGINPRRGTLDGNVQIVFDRSTRPDAGPMENRPDDLVRVIVDNLKFNNDQLLVETDSSFALFSVETDILGRGLSISWNESPRELRQLRIARGDVMIVKNVPEELDVISLPGGATTQAAMVLARPVPEANAASPLVAMTVPTTPATGATTSPKSKPAKEPGRNVYLAEFVDAERGVNVDSGDRTLHNAEKLSLTFQWGRGSAFSFRSREGAAAATAPATMAAVPGAATTSAASQPGAKRRTQAMVITWSGPLTLRPLSYTPAPSRNDFEVLAEGGNLVLADNRAVATCQEFRFKNPQQQGWLKGAEEQPARLELASGAEVVCAYMAFDANSGEALLDGPGYMTGRPESLSLAEAASRPATQATTQPEKLDAVMDRIDWKSKAEVAFSRERVQRRDGTIQTTQRIRDVVFHGDVKGVQGKTGDFVRCDVLQALLDRGRGRAEYVSRVIAIGNVSGRQEARDIHGDKLTLDFEEYVQEDADAVEQWRVRPAALVAEGRVKVGEQRQDGKPPLLAEADLMNADLVRRSAVLKGRPASIAQGENQIEGKDIFLDEATEAAAVNGAGQLRFLTDKDLSGGRLPTPRLLNVVWANNMNYLGKQDTALFDGNVVLTSGLDRMQCQRMHMLFEPRATTQPATAPGQPATAPGEGEPVVVAVHASRPLAAGGPKTRPVKDKPDQRLGLGIENFSGRKLAIIQLERGVKINTSRLDVRGRLLQRVQMQSDGNALTYNAQTDEVHCLGHGTLVAEDYRAPMSRKESEGSDFGSAFDRPYQWAFEWGKFMSFDQKERLVTMDSDVKMIYHGGMYLIPPEGLNVPAWPDLKEGRVTKIRCGWLEAKFAPRVPRPTSGPATATTSAPASREAEEWVMGPKLGPLERFTARHSVNMEDGVRQKRQILCQELLYDRPTDVVTIYGFLRNQPPANAVLIYEDKDAGTSSPMQSPKIIWYRKNDRIETPQLSAEGGR